MHPCVAARNIVTFFDDVDTDGVKALQHQLALKMGHLRQYSSTQLKQLVHMKVTTDFSASTNQVTLCIPQNTMDGESSVAMLDLETISVATEMSRVAEDYPFERYSLKLGGLQVSLAEDLAQWKMFSEDPSAPIHLLSRMDLAVHFEKCFVENDIRFSKKKLFINATSFELQAFAQTSSQISALVQSVTAHQQAQQHSAQHIPIRNSTNNATMQALSMEHVAGDMSSSICRACSWVQIGLHLCTWIKWACICARGSSTYQESPHPLTVPDHGPPFCYPGLHIKGGHSLLPWPEPSCDR